MGYAYRLNRERSDPTIMFTSKREDKTTNKKSDGRTEAVEEDEEVLVDAIGARGVREWDREC